jgi:hypothetical protein
MRKALLRTALSTTLVLRQQIRSNWDHIHLQHFTCAFFPAPRPSTRGSRQLIAPTAMEGVPAPAPIHQGCK